MGGSPTSAPLLASGPFRPGRTWSELAGGAPGGAATDADPATGSRGRGAARGGPASPVRRMTPARGAPQDGVVSGRRIPGRRLRGRPAALTRVVRKRGRSAALRALRMTGATVAAFLVAQLVGLRTPPPLIAALTALLVVQATLTSTLVAGVQRVLSVVCGVALAVLFVGAVGLTWWSLAALVAVSILVGQLLRLGPQLVEVPISAMLVLGVGHSGAGSVGGGRVLETLVGAAVGVLVNVVFPPAVQTRHAAQAVQRVAGEIAALLHDAAATLAAGPVLPEQSTRWLEDARRLNRHAPRVDRALAHAEESRRLNVRALGVPPVGPGMRTGAGRPGARLGVAADPVPRHRRRHPGVDRGAGGRRLRRPDPPHHGEPAGAHGLAGPGVRRGRHRRRHGRGRPAAAAAPRRAGGTPQRPDPGAKRADRRPPQRHRPVGAQLRAPDDGRPAARRARAARVRRRAGVRGACRAGAARHRPGRAPAADAPSARGPAPRRD